MAKVELLVCTVGGSPAPILTAITHHQPAHVLFVCSERDPATGKEGSTSVVPSLREAAKLDEIASSVLVVPADNPTEISRLIAERIHGKHGVVIDYTGGTKGMSIGAFLAAALHDGGAASVVLGDREDHVRISSGSYAATADLTPLHDRFRQDAAARAWSSHLYAEAVQILEPSRAPALRRVHGLSRGYAAWDAWQHEAANKVLTGTFRDFVAPELKGTIAQLASAGRSPRGVALQVLDIYRMAERRAVAQRYDDAVVLLYRCVEWMAQWALKYVHKLDPDDFPRDHLAAPATRALGVGPLKLGLQDSWAVLAAIEGPLATVAKDTARERLDFVKARNSSIYAHGQAAATAEDWGRRKKWLDDRVLHVFLSVNGVPPLPSQLPTAFETLRAEIR